MPPGLLRDRRWLLASGLVALVIAWVAVHAMLGPQVTAYRIGRQELVARVLASGHVMSPPRIAVGSLSVAQVAQVLVDEGERVERGQLLVQLEDGEPRAATAAARAAVAQASARLEELRTAASEPPPRETRQARAALEAARARLALAESRLAQSRLQAPAAGVVLSRAAEPGDVVQPGQVLLVLSLAGETRLSVQPDERNLGLLRSGQQALAVADAFPGQVFSAEVRFIAPAVDATRGAVEARLLVPDPPSFLRPDMAVSVFVEVARKPGALVAPAEAVRETAGETYVLALRGCRAERRPVTLGLRGEGLVEVTSGLAEGDEVLRASSGAVAGQRVRPRAAKPVELAHAL
jgi:HlyD family secretion protein